MGGAGKPGASIDCLDEITANIFCRLVLKVGVGQRVRYCNLQVVALAARQAVALAPLIDINGELLFSDGQLALRNGGSEGERESNLWRSNFSLPHCAPIG